MSNSYTLKGSIKVLEDTNVISDKFSKREFVVTVPDEKYPQDIKLEVVNDKCDALNQFSVGQEVLVEFNLRGNEYNDRFYVNLSAWKVTAVGDAPKLPTPQSQSRNTPVPPSFDDDDDIPF